MNSQTLPKILHLSAADSMLFPILRDQLKYLRRAGYEIHTASIDGPLGRRIRDDDAFPWTPLPLTREFAPLSDWRAREFIESLCRENGYHAVHTHTPKGNLIGQWAARRAGVPVVLQTLHGFYFHDRMSALKRRAWIEVERFSASLSDHILCQNPEDVATAIREGIVSPDRISLLGNGIDLERFVPVRTDAPERLRTRAELGIQGDAFVVGMVGRFVAEKGFPEFMTAGETLASQIPNLHILAVGHKLASERAGEAWTPQQAKALQGRMTVLSDRDDMPALYACMDVHVLPSHREGFPRALMEGAATGLPQICTDIRGCRQTVEDGKTGFIIPVGNAAELADRIARLSLDAGLRAKFGAAARQKAIVEFDQTKVFKIVEECYRKLFSKHHP